jgi:hypothetical protein
VSRHLIGSQEAGKAPLPPAAELQWWYQYYFATERGRAGYDKYRHDFSKLIWQLASPKWNFDDATFDRTAASFENPDHVAIVIHHCRWRLGLAGGEPKYDDLEKRLAEGPVITVPSITLEGDANGAPHPEPAAYRSKFSGKYEHRLIKVARIDFVLMTRGGSMTVGRLRPERTRLFDREFSPPRRSASRAPTK